MVSALESKLTKDEVSTAPKREEAKSSMDTTRRKAYSEVVKQKTPREGIGSMCTHIIPTINILNAGN